MLEKSRRYAMQRRAFQFIVVLILFFILVFPSLRVAADPGASWPTSWVQIDWDKNENGPIDDWRDVKYAYYQCDSEYLYLKFECYDTPGKNWPEKARYKWFIDLEGDMYHSGESVYDAEYLLFVEDATDDGFGEMYLLYNANGDITFDEYEPWPPANYADYEVTNTSIGGWRIVSPYQIEMYISWSSIGNPSSYWLTWATDQQNPNLDQGPTTDHADEEQPIAVHDVATISQTPTPTNVTQGETVTVEVVVENQGTQTETFNVTCYFDSSVIATQLVTNLTAANSITLNFSWDTTGVSLGTYNITAWADSSEVITENDEADNWCTAPATVTVTVVGYYLTVETDPADITTILGEGWYANCTYVNLTAPAVVPNVTGVQYVFDYWTVDGGFVCGNPITVHMNANHTATAHYFQQYYLTVSSDHGTPGGEGWYNASTTAYATITPLVVSGPAGVQYVFTGWSGDATGSTSPSDPITMDGPKTAVANWKTQYLVTFNQTGLDANATGTVVTVNGSAKAFGDLPFAWWVDNCSWVEYSYSVLVSSLDPNENFTLIDVTGPASPFHVGSQVTVTGNYQSQFQYYLDVSSDYGTPGGIGWYDNGTTAYVTLATDIIDHGNGTRRVFTHWSGDASGTDYSQSNPITMDSNKTAIANWKTQYYLDVPSPYGTPGGEGWYDSGSTPNATLDTGIIDHGNGTRRVFTQWGGDASGTNYAQSDPITMDGPKTATANWKTQYYLTVSSAHGTPGGEGWYNASDTAYATITPLTVAGAPGVQYVFTGWSGDASGSSSPSDPITMDGPKTAVANWKTQYYLDVVSPYATPSGEGWYDSGSTAYATVSINIVDHGNGTRRVFVNWTGDASGSGTTSDPITMNAPKTAIANWKTQYYLTVETDPSGLSPAPTPPSNWYDNCTYVVLTAPDQSYLGAVEYNFAYWDVDGANDTNNPITVHMNQPHTATAHYQPKAYGPTAKFTEDPLYPEANETITFDASTSEPGFNGTHSIPIVNYTWDFGDGNITTVDTPIITHVYANPGVYNVTLTVYAPGATPDTDTTVEQKIVKQPIVGGHFVFINKLQLLAPQIGIALALLATTVITTIRIKRKRKTH